MKGCKATRLHSSVSGTGKQKLMSYGSLGPCMFAPLTREDSDIRFGREAKRYGATASHFDTNQ